MHIINISVNVPVLANRQIFSCSPLAKSLKQEQQETTKYWYSNNIQYSVHVAMPASNKKEQNKVKQC